MSEPELSADQFREAANHAIRAVLNLYTEVRNLFAELASALGADEPALAPITNALQPKPRKTHYEDKVLPRWTGYLYRPDEGDEDALVEDDEDEEDGEAEGETLAKGRRVILPWGSAMAFARVILYQPGSMDWEPVVQFGVLTAAHVNIANYPRDEGLNVRMPSLRAVLNEIPEEPKTSLKKELVCKRVKVPSIKGLAASPKERQLRLTLPGAPVVRPLFSIDSTAKVATLANDIRKLWGQHEA